MTARACAIGPLDAMAPMRCALGGRSHMPELTAVVALGLRQQQHWDRLLGGLLYATSPRVDWASLLRLSFSVDVLDCPKCRGRLRVVAVITEREPVRRILAHLGMPTEPPALARARDPTDEPDAVDAVAQLAL